jgi:peptidoglycan/xylan/chitin deacetylase (PgdA/CDA1 family)
MAATVDDLPTTGSMPSTIDRPAIARKIISALNKHSVPEPFGFINAKQIDDAPPLAVILREWTAAGFSVGNHTYSHLNLENVGADEFIEDIRRNEPRRSGFFLRVGISSFSGIRIFEKGSRRKNGSW